MNEVIKVLSARDNINIDTISKAFIELKNLEKKFLNSNDYVNIKWKTYIKKSWFRKLSLILWISTEVVKHNRIDKDKYFIHEFTVRATATNGRFIECSWACSSNERDFNHIENDTITTAQTRASSRAISDLLGIWEIFHEDTKTISKNTSSNATTNLNNYNNSNTSNDHITNKQKTYLIKLVESKYQDEHTRNSLYKRIDTLNKVQAGDTIKQLLEEWVGT